MTLFSSGQLMIIPFDRHFTECEQDKNLKTLFAQPENQSAILNWLIAGYRLLVEEGLQPPSSVLAATGIYQEDSDHIAQFVQDQLIEIPGTEVRTSEVYARYRRWCENNAIPLETNRNFNTSLRRIADITRKRPKAGGGMTTMLLGYQLVPTENGNK
jgi:putative DNA primase/helicase